MNLVEHPAKPGRVIVSLAGRQRRALLGELRDRLPNSSLCLRAPYSPERAAIYITLIEHPARMQCGVEIAATEFEPSYRRATVMQATCAALGLASSVAAWVAGASLWWLVAGVLLGSVLPFTLIAIMPTNKRLLSPTFDRRSEGEGFAHTMGQTVCRAKRTQRIGIAAFPFRLVFKPT